MAIILNSIVRAEENKYDLELVEDGVSIVFRFVYRPETGGAAINSDFVDYLWDRADADAVLLALIDFIKGKKVKLPVSVRQDRTGSRWT